MIAALDAQLLEPRGKLPRQVRMLRVAMQITHLAGIGMQIVKLELLRLGEV